MEQIDERARALGFNLIVRMIDASSTIDEEIRAISASGISGMLIFATEMLDDDMEHFKQASIPVVSLDNDFAHLAIDSVVINNKVGTYKAIEHLVHLGHARIGHLQCKTRINSFNEREEGYQKAAERFGLQLSMRHIFRLGFTEEESYQDFRKILAGNADLPTAFVSDTDTIAAGVMRALLEYGVAVPDVISMVGFDNRPLCQVIIPHLTSISVPKTFGSRAVELLAERINTPMENEFDYRKIEIGVGIVIRESTRLSTPFAAAKFSPH
jgi:Transcriptional regulators